MADKIMYLKEAAQYVGRARYTLQSWDRKGKLKSHRTATNRCYYYQSELDRFLGRTSSRRDTDQREIVAYARVSSQGQKSDLKDQTAFLRQYLNARGIIADKYIEDIGSGLNYKRPKWLGLIKAIDQNKVKQVYVTYEDRFIRFGFDFFKQFCAWHKCQIIVLNNRATSPDKELVDDLVSIIHVFSCRLYGLKRYKNKIKNDPTLKEDER